ncbi:hypothetical protein CAC01_13480 [Streptomyces sp. CLI2509]|nr:hypothetical protein CAC01_13480 [Streptomyces sp. CLI2509]
MRAVRAESHRGSREAVWGSVAHIAIDVASLRVASLRVASLRVASLRLGDLHQPDAGARRFGNADRHP